MMKQSRRNFFKAAAAVAAALPAVHAAERFLVGTYGLPKDVDPAPVSPDESDAGEIWTRVTPTYRLEVRYAWVTAWGAND